MARIITALTAQKRNPARINVFLDGDFAFSLSRIVASWLITGQELSEEKIAALQAEDEREAAIQQALRFITYRERSEAEVRQNLARHEISEEVTEAVLARLRENGMIDDERFARHWVENRNEFRPRGRRALAFELRRKGVSPEAIDTALEAVDEEALAYQAALKAARRWESLEWKDFRNKVISFLARRGFNFDSAAQAATRIWSEKQADSHYFDHHP